MMSYTIELFGQAIKRYQGQMREAECGYEEEQRQRQEVDSIKLRTHQMQPASCYLIKY